MREMKFNSLWSRSLGVYHPWNQGAFRRMPCDEQSEMSMLEELKQPDSDGYSAGCAMSVLTLT